MWNLYVEFVCGICAELLSGEGTRTPAPQRLVSLLWGTDWEGESAVYYGEMTGEGDSAPGGSYWVAHP